MVSEQSRAHTVLVTGAAGGIGRAIVDECLSRKWSVCATVRSLDALGAEDPLRHCGAIIEELDVRDELRCREVIDKFRPTAIVNNAGVGAAGAIEDVSLADARAALEIMAVAPMNLARLAVPYMRENHFGRIVNVSSVAGRASAPLVGWYTASKAALETLSDSLRMELANTGIAVSIVAPGGIDTGILEKSVEAANVPGSGFEENYRRAEKLTNLTYRFNGSAQRVAHVVANAIESPKPKARYVVGLDARLLLTAGRCTPLRIRDAFKRRVLKL